ncbi:unnamed protein product [Trichogramma brassicae]|uniref:Uncharacterized protein n=1 Tax=Trichogramma brassicae TaxID=86971 RepID=A0A6H5HYM3_9HYME|nr:unnamed protein product [Trichogramma brassicae]
MNGLSTPGVAGQRIKDKQRNMSLPRVYFDMTVDGQSVGPQLPPRHPQLNVPGWRLHQPQRNRRQVQPTIRERTYDQKGESKICCESERSSSVRVKRDILGDVYVGLTSTARLVRSYVVRVKSASAGTSRSECARGEPVDPTDEQTTRTTKGGPGPGEDLDIVCVFRIFTLPPSNDDDDWPNVLFELSHDKYRPLQVNAKNNSGDVPLLYALQAGVTRN